MVIEGEGNREKGRRKSDRGRVGVEWERSRGVERRRGAWMGRVVVTHQSPDYLIPHNS